MLGMFELGEDLQKNLNLKITLLHTFSLFQGLSATQIYLWELYYSSET